MPAFNYWVVKGIYSNRKQYTRRASRKVLKILLHNLPKVLFLFMPFSPLIFGFSTKNDGITLIMAFFTSLFSFLLLLIFLLLFLTNKVLSLFQESSILSFSTGLLILWVWMVYYFFRHTIFYHETRLISFLKSSFLFLINFIIIISCLAIFYTFINLK
jgi:hypothetical protein